MNKKGFTLIEILVVITIMGILVAIAVPASQGISKKINEKIYNSKMNLAIEGAKIWGEDNNTCFTCVGGSCPEECLDLECFYESDDEKICEISIGSLVKYKYFKYDKIVDGEEKVIDPRNNNKYLNEEKVKIVYYKKTEIVNAY